MSKAKEIVDEIRQKVEDYERNQSKFLSNVGEWGDIFAIKRPARKENTFSNPRLTEMFRATNALATMMYRMQTSQDPFFETVPMSPLTGDDQLLDVQTVLDTQLIESQFKRNLLTADMGMILCGTTIVQEDYDVVGVNQFGRRLPVTTFRPRSLLQVAFERGCTSLDQADWLSTSDLISDAGLMRLGSLAGPLGQPWNAKVLEFAAKENVKSEELNQFVLNRLNRLGYMSSSDKTSRKELVMYYGKLDCLNDGVEYVAALVNRKHLARFHPNKNQHGKRNFRVGTWIEDPLTIDALGLGLGGLLADLHRSMDSNRQKLQDKISMWAYNMWARLRTAGIDDNDLKIRPLQIVDMDERDGITPLKMEAGGAEAALKLEELLKNEFMNASGATPTLQAQVTEATASEVSLAQNEGVRNISVKTEIASEQLIREHLRIMHSNNAEFIKKPININRAGIAKMIYPSDLKVDVDFKLKITTDKDFKPKRLENLMNLLQVLVSTKSQHPDQLQISIIPIVQEIARALGVPAKDVILPAPRMPMQVGQGQPMGMGGMPTGPDMSAQAGPEQFIQTPVGPVLGSPTQ